MPGIEKISVKISTRKKASGHLANSLEKQDSTVPLAIAFNNAVNTHIVKLKNIDLNNFTIKALCFSKLVHKKITWSP